MNENKHSKKENKTTKKEENKENKNLIINKKDKKKKKHPKLRMFIKIVLIILLILIVAAVAGVIAIFKTDKWAITKEQLLSDAGATIYDKDGKEIETLTGNEINKKVSLTDMGKLPEAFVAIEDERFYTNKEGVDIVRTLHAALKYVLSGGKSSFGGSTITQQLVKITMNDDERSGLAGIERKIREWSRASQVEKLLTKDQILERYLNRIYLGSSSGLEVRGVEAASNFYFNKSAKDLTLAQSAFIAGINHAPNNYNPFDSSTDVSGKIKTRTLTVLDKMHDLEKITDDEYNNAVTETNNGLAFTKGSLSNGTSDLSYHTAAAVNQIATELAAQNDLSYSEAREMLITSGYKIYTTVDTSIQSQMEEVYQNSKYKVNGTSSKTKDKEGQSAMVIIEPSTGYVVGEVGGLGTDQNTLGLNRGTSSRQGGSAFKPLVTIAPGLENNVITASTLFYDVKTTFGGNYTVENDSSAYYGIANMRTILTHSCNVPEVKLLSIMGTDKSSEFLNKINIDSSNSNAGLSMALGTIDVSPVQMAAGYAMIANGGTYITPTFYTKVEDQNGKTIIEAKQDKTRVMSEANAYIEADLLTGPIKSGTASSFNNFLGNMEVSGKTGTTTDAIDRWFCGFTPYYAAACWYGNDNGYENKVSFYNVSGKNPAATVWFNVMKAVHSNLEAKDYTKPDSIVEVKICKETGKKATDKCTNTYTEIFSKDNIPDDCDGHETVKVCTDTGLLATDYCPNTEYKSYGFVIDTEKNATWSPKLSEKTAPTESCNVHTTPAQIDVPNVVGKTQPDAETLLKNAGFTVKILKNDDNTKAKGIVLKQSATKAAQGAEITITVNQYSGTVVSNTTSGGGAENTSGGTTAPITNTQTTTTTGSDILD